jgi:hypothetical protein
MSLKNNPYYIEYDYSDKSTIDPNVLATVMQVKQKKYDVESQRLKDFSTQLSNIPLIKDETKKYFADRISTLRSEVEKVGKGVDLSKSGTTDKIMSYLGQAADDIVMEDYRVAKIQENILKQAEDARLKGKGVYSDINLQYSLEGIQKWAKNSPMGKRYDDPRTSYIPFVDIQTEATKLIKEINPNYDVKVDRTGRYTIISQTKEEVNDVKIHAALDAAMMSNPALQSQIRVNSWSENRGVDDNMFVERVKTTAKEKITLIDDALAELDAEKVTKGNSVEIQNTIDYLKEKKESWVAINNEDANQIKTRRELIEIDDYRQRFYDNMTKVFKYSKISEPKIQTDQGLYYEDKLNFDKAKDLLDRELANKKLSLETNKRISELYDEILEHRKKGEQPQEARKTQELNNLLGDRSIDEVKAEIGGYSLTDVTKDDVSLEKTQKAQGAKDMLNNTFSSLEDSAKTMAEKYIKGYDDLTEKAKSETIKKIISNIQEGKEPIAEESLNKGNEIDYANAKIKLKDLADSNTYFQNLYEQKIESTAPQGLSEALSIKAPTEQELSFLGVNTGIKANTQASTLGGFLLDKVIGENRSLFNLVPFFDAGTSIKKDVYGNRIEEKKVGNLDISIVTDNQNKNTYIVKDKNKGTVEKLTSYSEYEDHIRNLYQVDKSLFLNEEQKDDVFSNVFETIEENVPLRYNYNFKGSATSSDVAELLQLVDISLFKDAERDNFDKIKKQAETLSKSGAITTSSQQVTVKIDASKNETEAATLNYGGKSFTINPFAGNSPAALALQRAIVNSMMKKDLKLLDAGNKMALQMTNKNIKDAGLANIANSDVVVGRETLQANVYLDHKANKNKTRDFFYTTDLVVKLSNGVEKRIGIVSEDNGVTEKERLIIIENELKSSPSLIKQYINEALK